MPSERDLFHGIYGDDLTPEELAQLKAEQASDDVPVIVEYADGRTERYDDQYKAMRMARGEDAPDYYERERPDPLILDQDGEVVELIGGKAYQALRNGATLRIYGTRTHWLREYDEDRPDATMRRA